MIGSAFQPQGNTVAITSAVASTAAVQVGTTSGQYLIQCVGAVPIFVNVGQTSSVGAAVIPTNGAPANGFPVQAGSSKVYTLPPGAWFTTIASATTSTLYITPGDGI